MRKDILEEIVKNITDERKEKIKREKETELNKINFFSEIFNENKVVLGEYIDEKKITIRDAYYELCGIINSLYTDLHLEGKEEGKLLQIKEVEKSLSVKLGYYEIFSNKKLDPEMFVEQCTLTPTKKGKEIRDRYQKISFNGAELLA